MHKSERYIQSYIIKQDWYSNFKVQKIQKKYTQKLQQTSPSFLVSVTADKSFNDHKQQNSLKFLEMWGEKPRNIQ